MKKFCVIIISVIMALSVFSLAACANKTPQNSGSQGDTTQSGGEGDNTAGGEEESGASQKQLGGLSPEAALEYMKKTENLVIVDVAAKRHYDSKHFTGAINIPIEELSSAEEDALYKEISSDRPVILHCRAGAIVPGAYKRVLELRSDIPEISYIAGAPLFNEYNEWLEGKNQGNNDSKDDDMNNDQNTTTQKLLGGLSPEAALEYIKSKPDIVIVQVNTAYWKIEPGFTNAMWIPHDEMATRYNEIPQGRPVILHCGAGIVSVPAYEVLIEKRPDIPELSYIAGSPHSIMAEYNAWLESQT